MKSWRPSPRLNPALMPGLDCRWLKPDNKEIKSQDKCASRVCFTGFFDIERQSILMNLIVSTHNVTLTKAIEDHLIARINKVEHLDQYITNIRVTLEHDQAKAPERQFSCS